MLETNQKDIHNLSHSFKSLDKSGKGRVDLNEILKTLKVNGISRKDPRLKDFYSKVDKLDGVKELTQKEFGQISKDQALLFDKVFQNQLIIPGFEAFSKEIENIYEEVKKNKNGKVADYIPQLKRVCPENFSVSICSIDGQIHSVGESDKYFSIQSTSKTLNYCMALEEFGQNKVHTHVGREPSGHGFNEITLDPKKRPHNPFINAGAIMTSSMVRPSYEPAERFDHVLDMWKRAAGGIQPSFNNAVYLSERATADRNFALAYFMRENKSFPDNTKLIETLEFYFQCCSIELTAEAMAVVSGTLANSGICPVTQDKLFNPDTVKNCLSLMASCGMYDFSGEFAFSIGLPAKSGVGGGLMIVIPNLMGICVWSPPLDKMGNSVKGIDFCERLVEKFNFHNFDSLIAGNTQKLDPRVNKNQVSSDDIQSLLWASSKGSLREIQALLARGFDLNQADYDGRTALHLAASEGHLSMVEYLLNHKADPFSKDRWGGTPLSDAEREGHKEVYALLKKQKEPKKSK
jgi:glutaminase